MRKVCVNSPSLSLSPTLLPPSFCFTPSAWNLFLFSFSFFFFFAIQCLFFLCMELQVPVPVSKNGFDIFSLSPPPLVGLLLQAGTSLLSHCTPPLRSTMAEFRHMPWFYVFFTTKEPSLTKKKLQKKLRLIPFFVHTSGEPPPLPIHLFTNSTTTYTNLFCFTPPLTDIYLENRWCLSLSIPNV